MTCIIIEINSSNIITYNDYYTCFIKKKKKNLIKFFQYKLIAYTCIEQDIR